jgi:hypothetical protein
MNIGTIEVCGFPGVLKALRKPFKKEMRSKITNFNQSFDDSEFISSSLTMKIDPKDIQLISKLVKAGDEHSKVLRGLIVYADFELPRYIWSEFDTYRIGKECLSSESTMHTILNEDVTEDDFEYCGLDLSEIIDIISDIKAQTIPRSEKKMEIKSILPESYLQTRTLMLSYQALRRIYFQRRHHELIQWQEICNWIKELPYSKELITIE